MDNKMALSEAWKRELRAEVVHIEEVEDIELVRDGVTTGRYFMEDGKSNAHIINPTIFKEQDGSVIAQSLVLLQVTKAPTKSIV